MADGYDPVWRRALGALLVIMALSVAGLAFLGTQTSAILSTVGAPVGLPGGDVEAPDDGLGSDEAPDDQGGDVRGSTAIMELQDVARPDLLIVRRGSITVQVVDLDAALLRAGAAIGTLGGYESGSRRAGRGDEAQAEVIYRFPASGWHDALAAIRAIGEDVIDEQSETTDVSAEVVDIEARIRNLRVTEGALQSIMDRASVIKDVLGVQAELTRVRSEIEQLSAKAAQLREQAAMSTLAVTFVLPETPAIARQEARFDPGREVEGATARLVELLQALATAGIWFGIVWLPVLLALAVVGGIIVLVARRLRARAGSGTPLMQHGGPA